MNARRQVVESLARFSESELADWLSRLVRGRASEPDFPFPRDYRTASEFLVAVLYGMDEQSILVRFGDAACVAFDHFLSSGGYVPQALKEDRGQVGGNLLFLVEALPSGAERARETATTLVSMLCSSALRAFPTKEEELHKRLLLALPGKLDVAQCYEPDAPRRLCEDLQTSDYAAAAFAVLIRLVPGRAAEYLETVIRTLRNVQYPTAQLFADLALAMTKHPIDPGGVFVVMADCVDRTLRLEFRKELEGLRLGELLRLWDEIFPSGLLVPTRELNPELMRAAVQVENFLMLELKKPSLLRTEYLSIKYAERLLAVMVERWEVGGNAGNPLVDCDELATTVRALDDDLWNGRRVFKNGMAMPSWFVDVAGRRRFAARVVRRCVCGVADKEYWKMDATVFAARVAELNLHTQLAEIAALLPIGASNLKTVTVNVSPFPEDQLFFLVLETAGKLRDQIGFKARPAPWADRNSLDADWSLMNEFALEEDVRKDTNPSHDIFKHNGYFVFYKSPSPPNIDERWSRAIKLGFRRYERGEYQLIAPRIEKKFKLPRLHLDPAKPWPEDFESFVVGGDHLYIGGSINSRLLLRLWGKTGRVYPICDPTDFLEAVGTPSNRLVLGPELRARLNETTVAQLIPRVVRLYRKIGMFFHEVAQEAMDQDPQGRAIIRHFMHVLADGMRVHEDGYWNFVVNEEDMCTLLLEDNSFVPFEPGLNVPAKVKVRV